MFEYKFTFKKQKSNKYGFYWRTPNYCNVGYIVEGNLKNDGYYYVSLSVADYCKAIIIDQIKFRPVKDKEYLIYSNYSLLDIADGSKPKLYLAGQFERTYAKPVPIFYDNNINLASVKIIRTNNCALGSVKLVIKN